MMGRAVAVLGGRVDVLHGQIARLGSLLLGMALLGSVEAPPQLLGMLQLVLIEVIHGDEHIWGARVGVGLADEGDGGETSTWAAVGGGSYRWRRQHGRGGSRPEACRHELVCVERLVPAQRSCADRRGEVDVAVGQQLVRSAGWVRSVGWGVGEGTTLEDGSVEGDGEGEKKAPIAGWGVGGMEIRGSQARGSRN